MSQENVEIVRRAFAYEIYGYALRGGKVLRVDEYADRAEALEAAGLRE